MAEALAVIGLVSAIVQFVDFGSKIVERLQDFHSSLNEVPKAFCDVKVELPQLIDTLKRTQIQAESRALSRQTHKALLPVVEVCRSQVELLTQIARNTACIKGPGAWKLLYEAQYCLNKN